MNHRPEKKNYHHTIYSKTHYHEKLIHTLALQSIKVKLLGLLLFLAGNLQACSDEETASIQVNADVLYFNGTGETQELQIKSSGEWTVTVAKGGEWCHYKMKENVPSILSVSTDANQTGKERLTRLIISSGSAEKEWKSIRGQPHPPPRPLIRKWIQICLFLH